MKIKVSPSIQLVCFVIINLILIFVFIIPAYSQSQALGKKIPEMQEKYYDRVEYGKSLLAALEMMKQYRIGLENVDTGLPKDFYLSPIIYFFQKETLEHHMNLVSVSFAKNISGAPVATTASEKPKSVIVTVTLSGTYHDFKKVLTAIDQSARLFEVQTLSFAVDSPSNVQSSSGESSTTTDRSSDVHYFKLQIKTYTYGL